MRGICNGTVKWEGGTVEIFCKNLITLRVFSETSIKKAFNSSVTPLNGKKELLLCPLASYDVTYIAS
jgi:hypothetical protein